MQLAADRIHTLDTARPSVTSLRVANGVIVELGEAVASDAIELDGATVVPGFVEHHCHFRSWAQQRSRVQLGDATDVDAVLTAVASCEDEVVVGVGLAEAALGSTEGLVRSLDDAVAGRAVVLVTRDGHGAVTTPRSLERLGLTLEDLDVPGGVIERRTDGSWNGILREESSWVVRRALPGTLTMDVVRDAVRDAARRGVTTIHDMDGLDALRTWAALAAHDGSLDARVVVHLLAADIGHVDEARALAATHPFITLGGLKLFADGTLGSGTALLHEPELPLPGRAPREGVAIVERPAIEQYARDAAVLGLPLLVHAIGDRAATDVIDALAATHDAWSDLERRPRIEHAQLMRTGDIDRCAQLGIELSVQPTMLVSDRDHADAHWGAERTSRAFAYRTMLDAGCTIRLGSDAPIEDLHPLAAIHAATHRDGGAHGLAAARGAWHPEQCISAHEALRASVAAPITVGAPADLVVLDGDPVTDPTAEHHVHATMLDGRWTSSP